MFPSVPKKGFGPTLPAPAPAPESEGDWLCVPSAPAGCPGPWDPRPGRPSGIRSFTQVTRSLRTNPRRRSQSHRSSLSRSQSVCKLRTYFWNSFHRVKWFSVVHAVPPPNKGSSFFGTRIQRLGWPTTWALRPRPSEYKMLDQGCPFVCIFAGFADPANFFS